MLALSLFGYYSSWESLGFLSNPWMLFIVIIKVKFKSLTILLHIVRWSVLSFMPITWDSWFKKRLSLLFISGQMINSLISLQSLFQKWILLSFVLFLGFGKLQLWGVYKYNSPSESLECCVDGVMLEPQVQLVRHISRSYRDNQLISWLYLWLRGQWDCTTRWLSCQRMMGWGLTRTERSKVDESQ